MTINEEEKLFKEQFLDLIKVAKKIKKPFITFQDECLLGTDETCASLSTISYNTDKFNLFKLPNYKNLKLTFYINDLLSWLKSFDIMDNHTLINSYGIIDPRTILLSDTNYAFQINQMFQRVQLYMNYVGMKTLVDYPIRKDEKFEDILKLKSSDGSKFYNLENRYMMSTFSSIHPVTKTDKMTVSIYELDGGKTFLADFFIKKKEEEIHEYIKYRNLLI